jgi:argininosuccinate synthase
MTNSSTGSRPILLAFSGGLDTSFCVPWLAETHGRPIITLTVDTGGIDADAARMLEDRSRALGAAAHHLVDARAGYLNRCCATS